MNLVNDTLSAKGLSTAPVYRVARESWAAVIESPFPDRQRLAITLSRGRLTGLRLLPGNAPLSGAVDSEGARVVEQLLAYFLHPAYAFDLDLAPVGTPFQHRVWDALAAIPPGGASTYGDLARRLGTSPRAVGGACRANPIPIVVPCHRVLGRNGPGGYMGRMDGPEARAKTWLLRHEGLV